MKTIKGQLRSTGHADYSAHVVAIGFRQKVAIGDDSKALTTIKPVEVRRSTTAAGAFSATLPAAEQLDGPILFRVHGPSGAVIGTHQVAAADLGSTVTLNVPPEKPIATPVAEVPPGPAKLTGRVLDSAGQRNVAGVQVLIRASAATAEEAAAEFAVVAAARTDAAGYFATAYPAGRWSEAFGEVAAETVQRVPIPLESDQSLPARVVLVIDAGAAPAAANGCACAEGVVPRVPDMEDVVASPATYSTDKGGRCVDFTAPNRTLEEYAYTLIVRTTDPEIQGLTLAAPAVDRVPPAMLDHIKDRLGLAGLARSAQRGTSLAAVPVTTEIATLRELLRGPRKPSVEAIQAALDEAARNEAAALLETARRGAASRAPLGAHNPIDWDDEPTFYQATTIAHGHLLQFRQTWKADGYSLGDLVYSLPLAPCQKKQIAIIDWERRETAQRSEELLTTEQLAAELNRDRDVREIVSTTIEETLKGTSAALTAGIGAGKGSVDPKTGAIFGVAGGAGLGLSAAFQQGSRELSASTLQRLRDTTAQAASAVRSQRATVVQTVAQGETVQVQTEVVANHNHCHALTIEYFEVLRHFRVEHTLVAVQECLFIPLPLARFTEAKALRWRGSLEQALRDRRLARGFDALDRIQAHYDGSDLPEQRYADETIEHLDGELRLVFGCPRPQDKEDGSFAADRWERLGSFLAKLGGAAAVFTRFLSGRSNAERDRAWERDILPDLALGFVDAMTFTLVSPAGTSSDAQLEASLISRPLAGVPLLVSVRPRNTAPAITRANVEAVVIALQAPPPEDAQVVMRSGSLRYRTAHRQDFLFRDLALNNDLTATDPARIDTPLNAAELRNPRAEDRELARRLIAHLNEHLEFYHRAIWFNMDAGRRHMLLDGVLAPGAAGLSVASVVENRVLAVVGNSLVMPVSAGLRLDPTVHRTHAADLLAYYTPAQPVPPMRVSVPTRGVFAEAVMGACNSCEKKDETRFWRWEESPCPDEPTAIQPVSAESRQSAAPDLTAKDFPAPIINLQNAPAAPDPTGLAAALQVLGTSNLFRDVTGLEGNQKNALAAFTASLDAAKAFGDKAAALELQRRMARDIDKVVDSVETAHASGAIDQQQREEHTSRALKALTGGGVGDEPVQMTIADAEKFAAFTSDLGPGGALTFDAKAQRLEGTAGTPSEEGAGGKTTAPGTTPPSNKPDLTPVIAYLGPKADPTATEPDGFIEAARNFHKEWGITVQDVTSMEKLIIALAKGKSFAAPKSGARRARVRYVGHAEIELFLPLFEDYPPAYGSSEASMRALTKSDNDLMRLLIERYPDLNETDSAGVEWWRELGKHLLEADAALAATFRIDDKTIPAAPVFAFLTHRVFVDQVKKSSTLDEDDKDTLEKASDFLRKGLPLSQPKAEVTKLTSALTALNDAGKVRTFFFISDAQDIQVIRAALAGLQRKVGGKTFRQLLNTARAKLKEAAFDIRGCAIGHDMDYLLAVRDLLDCTEVTAPDLFMQFQVNASIEPTLNSATDAPLKDAAALEDLMVAPDLAPAENSDPDLRPAMERWALREFPEEWQKAQADVTVEAKLFFDRFLSQDRVLPVCNVNTEKVKLYYSSSAKNAKLNWLKSLWDIPPSKGAAGSLAKAWTTTKGPSVAAVLDINQFFVCSEPEYRDHIKSTASP